MKSAPTILLCALGLLLTGVPGVALEAVQTGVLTVNPKPQSTPACATPQSTPACPKKRNGEECIKIGEDVLVASQSATLCGSFVPLADVLKSLDGRRVSYRRLAPDDSHGIDWLCPADFGEGPFGQFLLVESARGGVGSHVLSGFPPRIAIDRDSDLLLVQRRDGGEKAAARGYDLGLLRTDATARPGSPPPAWQLTVGEGGQRDVILVSASEWGDSPLALEIGLQPRGDKGSADKGAEKKETAEPVVSRETRRLYVDSDNYGMNFDLLDSIAFVRSQLRSDYVPAPGFSIMWSYRSRRRGGWRALVPALGVSAHFLDFDAERGTEFGFAGNVAFANGALIFGYGRNISIDLQHRDYFFFGTSLRALLDGLKRLKGRQAELL